MSWNHNLETFDVVEPLMTLDESRCENPDCHHLGILYASKLVFPGDMKLVAYFCASCVVEYQGHFPSSKRSPFLTFKIISIRRVEHES